MKKLLSVLLILLVSVFSVFALASCDEESDIVFEDI